MARQIALAELSTGRSASRLAAFPKRSRGLLLRLGERPGEERYQKPTKRQSHGRYLPSGAESSRGRLLRPKASVDLLAVAALEIEVPELEVNVGQLEKDVVRMVGRA